MNKGFQLAPFISLAVSAFGRFCWKSRPWFPQQKSMRPRLKYILSAEASGLRFHVAVCKKGVLTSQWPGCLGVPTFSTESVVFCRSRSAAMGWSGLIAVRTVWSAL